MAFQEVPEVRVRPIGIGRLTRGRGRLPSQNTGKRLNHSIRIDLIRELAKK